MPSVPTIPGVNSTYSKMVEDLMKVERIPLDKKTKQIEATKKEKGYWQKINSHLNTLLNSTKTLYGFENPFNQKLGESSNESVLTVSPTRDSQIQDFDITVLDMAKGDKFRSGNLPMNFHVPKGQYIFGVGEKEVAFYFKGGNIDDFSDTINQKSKHLIKSSLVKIDKENQVWLLESTQVGKGQRLNFKKDAFPLALNTKMINDTPLLPSRNTLSNAFSLSPHEKKSLPFPKLEEMRGELVIEYHLGNKTEDASDVKGESGSTLNATDKQFDLSNPALAENDANHSALNTQANEAPANATEETQSELKDPLIPSSGSVTVEDVTLFQAPSWADFTKEELEKLQKDGSSEEVNSDKDTDDEKADEGQDEIDINDPNLTEAEREAAIQKKLSELTLDRISGKKYIQLPSDKNELRIDLESVQDLQNLLFKNPHHDQLTIDSVYISDGTERTYTPENAISMAQDAKLNYNDLTVTRSTNNIDDLVQGVTLNIKGESDEPVHIDIKSDSESIKNALFEFVYNYNNMMQTINIFTSSDSKVLEELTYLEEDQRKELEEALGTLKGDNTLNTLKSTIQQSATNLWMTSPNNSINILSKMGIGSNMTSAAGVFDRSKLRGYLEIDEKLLDESIENHLDEMKNFFGYDSDGDLVMDKGMAHGLAEKLQGYTQTGGILFTKFRTFDNQVKSMEKETQIMEEKLKDKEFDYKTKFGRMESLIDEMNSNAKSLDSLKQQNNQ